MRDTAREGVEIVAELIVEGEGAFEQGRGSQALGEVREIESALVEQLEGSLGRVLLWEQFLRTPESVLPAVVSVVKSPLDHDVDLAWWLGQSLEAYRREADRLQ